MIAEGPLDRSGFAGEPDGEEREGDGRAVGEHVQRVGDEREASRDNAADDLGDHVGQDQEQRKGQPLAAEVAVIVAVIVVMVVSLARGGADVALVFMVVVMAVVMAVIVVVPVIVVVVMAVIVVMAVGTAFDGEVQGVGGSVSPQRAAKPAEYAPASRCLVRCGLREGPSERGSVYSHT